MRLLACTSILALCGTVHALPPDQVVERVSPGVWALRTLDANNQPFNHGTAVAIAPGKAVTSCAVLQRASKLELRREQVVLAATLEFPDVERDLCQLDVPGLQAPEALRAAPRLGQRVYAIGYERGTDLSIVDGLYSRMRDGGTNAERIQTSVTGSAGLTGAGLYDEEARLLGIVTASPADASALLFALPSKWLAEIPERGRAVLAARAAPPAKSAGGLPAVGTAWNYNYVFRGVGATRVPIFVRVSAVEGQVVKESIVIGTSPAQHTSNAADQLAFKSLPLPRSQTLLEFAPYLHAVMSKIESPAWGRISGYPAGNAAIAPWILAVRDPVEEEVAVPAGVFKATKIEIRGRRQAPGGFAGHMLAESTRFLVRVWYSPLTGRYVKLQHETWNLRGDWSGEQLIELTAHSER